MSTYSNTGSRVFKWGVQITKLESFLPKNQHTQMKSLNFENLFNGEVSKIARLSKSIHYVKNHPNLSHFFFSLNTINLEAHFFLLTFFDI